MANNIPNQDFALFGNDLAFVNGDIAIAQSDAQHVTDIMNAFPGWFKETPYLGVGILQYRNSSGQSQKLLSSVRIMLGTDGYTLGNPTVTISPAGVLTVDPDVQPQTGQS